MPTGLFAPSRNGSYVPLGREFECTTLMHPFILKKQEAILEKAWSEAIPWLRSPDVGNTNTFTYPWLDYDPHLKGGSDVYFVLDVENERVKIGVSNNISQRVNTLKRQYGAKKLIFISIIPSGGVKAESALHRFFSPLRIEKKGLGREWFSYTDELSDFVNSLNKYAIRSKCLKAYGII
ncbi:GIY-YIG nuclease family protein [Xenorhabdus entomophaga]|uniref:GIY-YIG nuclease family protein n=1 Tax=Xenorhabdus entomophaga TaxID=3136257 RepID=UPI0030F3773A